MIVLSNPVAVQNEMDIIHGLFEAGMELFHIRKPDMPQSELTHYISQIDPQYHSKIVLHQYFEIARGFNIHRLHFTERARIDFENIRVSFPIDVNWIFSASTHSIEDFNALSRMFQYAFLSPVFESISKPGYKPDFDMTTILRKRENFQTRLVGLGGINSSNCAQLYKAGFDDAAMLGSIWNAGRPIEEFKKCLIQEHHD